jgi:hypothetical protein
MLAFLLASKEMKNTAGVIDHAGRRNLGTEDFEQAVPADTHRQRK